MDTTGHADDLSRYSAIAHAASSGGTIISKLLIRSHRVVVLSEVHPFRVRGGFNPSNPVALASSQLNFSEEELSDQFYHQMRIVLRAAERENLKVLVRVHSHSDFWAKRSFFSADTLLDGASQRVVTVRDPFWNWLSASQRKMTSLTLRGWLARFGNFLEEHPFPLFLYEEIMISGDSVLSTMGRELGLMPRKNKLSWKEVPRLSGDRRREDFISPKSFRQLMFTRAEELKFDDRITQLLRKNSRQLLELRQRIGLVAFAERNNLTNVFPGMEDPRAR